MRGEEELHRRSVAAIPFIAMREESPSAPAVIQETAAMAGLQRSAAPAHDVRRHGAVFLQGRRGCGDGATHRAGGVRPAMAAEEVEGELKATTTHLRLHDDSELASASHQGSYLSTVQQLSMAGRGRVRRRQRRARTGTSARVPPL